MNRNRMVLAICLAAWTAVSSAAQDDTQQALEAEARRLEAERAEVARRAEIDARRSEVERREGAQAIEHRLREAEERLAEAARQVADLSMAQLPQIERIERIVQSGAPVLGITIGNAAEDGPVEGVEIMGISPGGAAEEAGLRAGDVITSVNGEALTSESAQAASRKLLDFMAGVEEGDKLDLEYLRAGNSASVTVTPRSMPNVFAFSFDGRDFSLPGLPHDGPRRFTNFLWAAQDDGFGDMELVTLTDRLGSYFGTNEGVLVVRAPKNEDLKLEDGDVILSIDGREPTSVSHAMRILGSYTAGETLKIEIMRDKRKRTVEVELPDNRQSVVTPSLAPAVPVPTRPVVIERNRT